MNEADSRALADIMGNECARCELHEENAKSHEENAKLQEKFNQLRDAIKNGKHYLIEELLKDDSIEEAAENDEGSFQIDTDETLKALESILEKIDSLKKLKEQDNENTK